MISGYRLILAGTMIAHRLKIYHVMATAMNIVSQQFRQLHFSFRTFARYRFLEEERFNQTSLIGHLLMFTADNQITAN